jgi:hypothetical protein
MLGSMRRNFKTSNKLGTVIKRNDIIEVLNDGLKIFLPHCRNSASGFLKQLHWIPKAQDDIITVLYRAKIALISITSSLLALFSRMDPSSIPQSTNVWNIIFILPEVKVGDSFTRRFL